MSSTKLHLVGFTKLHNTLFHKISSRLMVHGKRAKAETILREALLKVREESFGNAGGFPRTVLAAIVQVCPALEVKSVRRGGGAFQVPFPLSRSRQLYMGLSWLVEGARIRRKKSSSSLKDALAREILEAAHGKGWATTQRKAMHKKAVSNRAFKHFRW